MSRMQDKVVLVVGGAGGIGAATAAGFRAEGAQVAVTCRNPAQRAALEAAGYAVFVADVADTASLQALQTGVAARFGRIDVLVHASGFTRAIAHGNLDALDDALIDEVFAVNWRGQFATLRELLPLLRHSEQALTVFVSSISGMNGIGSNIAYCAAKAGIDVMVKSLARALAPQIRVMGVSPGVVDTGFVPGRDAATTAKIGAGIPLGRVASPEDVAEAIVACATALRYSTGSTVLVDGGRLL